MANACSGHSFGNFVIDKKCRFFGSPEKMDQRWYESIALEEYLVGDELAGPEVSLVQKRSCSSQRVELRSRRDLLEKRAKGRVRHCARSIPRVTDLFD